MHMPEAGCQTGRPLLDVQALAVPPQQGFDGESVPQIMQAGPRESDRSRKPGCRESYTNVCCSVSCTILVPRSERKKAGSRGCGQRRSHCTAQPAKAWRGDSCTGRQRDLKTPHYVGREAR